MITEDYVSFEVAKILKERGFNGEDAENCFAFYNKNGEISFLQTFGDIADYYNSENPVFAPTLQMAMKWLRKVHHKYCDIRYDIDLYWFFHIIELKELKEHFDYSELKYYHTENETGFNSYEEACEAAIIYCLENLI